MTGVARSPSASSALLEGGWARDVTITVDDAGMIRELATGVPLPGAQRPAGPVLPGKTDLHAMPSNAPWRGLRERRGPAGDDHFWT